MVLASEDVKIHKSHINSKNQTTIFPPSHSLAPLPTPKKYPYDACTMFSHVTGHEKLRALLARKKCITVIGKKKRKAMQTRSIVSYGIHDGIKAERHHLQSKIEF